MVSSVSKYCIHDVTNFALYLPPFQDAFNLQAITCLISIICTFIYLRSFLKRRHDPEACKRIGLVSSSHLADEHDHRYDSARQKDEGAQWRIKSLWIYPVKSCKGVELDRGAVTGVGLEYDRHFSFAQYTQLSYSAPVTYGWKFMTQRQIPALAKVSVEMWVPDASSPTYSSQHQNVQSGGVVIIKWPRYTQASSAWNKAWRMLTFTTQRSVQIPYNPTPDQIESHGYTTQDMKIWDDTTPSLLIAHTGGWGGFVGKDTWVQDLRGYLNAECYYQHPPIKDEKGKEKPRFQIDTDKAFGLFRVDSQQPREIHRNAPPKEELGFQPTVGFQDSYPLHILNLAAVHDVTSKLTPGARPLSAKNFRPNIVITGGEAYAEDDWKRIKVGRFEYYVSCRTTRCLLPNVDPSTGKADPLEPNKTLRSFRRIDKGSPNTACLGMQMVPAEEGKVEISVGDEIHVMETGEHFFLKH
ncbi:MAG: hypothetical protein Q9217_001703 [Psora testacea]